MQTCDTMRLTWDPDRYDYISVQTFFLVTWNIWDHSGPSRFANVLCFSFLAGSDLQNLCWTCYGIYIDRSDILIRLDEYSSSAGLSCPRWFNLAQVFHSQLRIMICNQCNPRHWLWKGERYPRLHLKNQRNGKRFDEDPLIGLETLFQCRRPPKEKACDVNPPSVTFTFRFPHVHSSFSCDLFVWCQSCVVSVGSVYAYTANMTTRLFGLAFCFSFSFLCAPRLPLFPNVVEQDSLGHQNDCLEALGFGVGGWGAVVGLRFVA